MPQRFNTTRRIVEIQKAAAFFLVMVHFLVLLLFIYTDFDHSLPNAWQNGLVLYQRITGLFRDYSYFAPSVARDMKADFVIQMHDGDTLIVPFNGEGREIGFRYSVIIASTMRNSRGRDMFAQSWASVLFGVYPEAERVMVIVKSLAVPTMAAYVTGVRLEWTTVYTGLFERKSEAKGY